MEITQETQNLMILRDRNVFSLFLIVISILLGLVILFLPSLFNNNVPLWFGIGSILLGLLILSKATITTITLDKSANKLSLQMQTITGKESRGCDLGDIKEINLKQSYVNVPSKRGVSHRINYNLFFVLSNGEEMPFLPKTVSSPSGIQILGVSMGEVSKGGGRAVGERVSRFLNVPFKEIGLPSVGEVLGAIKETMEKEIEKAQQKMEKK